jgi:hypothetical protein
MVAISKLEVFLNWLQIRTIFDYFDHCHHRESNETYHTHYHHENVETLICIGGCHILELQEPKE